MEGYADTIPLYEGALEAAGTTQQKYNVYLQSTQAHIDRLKATFEGLWNDTFSSSQINRFIDLATEIVSAVDNIIERFGFAPLFIGGAAVAFRYATGGLQDFANQLKIGEKFIESTNARLATFATRGKMASSVARLLTLSVNGLVGAFRSLAASVLIGGGFFILGAALEGLINLITKASRAHKEYIETLKSEVYEQQEQTKRLEELFNQYSKFNGSQEELNTLMGEMASLMPEIISHYNAEGEAVYKTREEIEKLIEAKRQELLLNQKILFDEETKSLKASAKAFEDNVKARQNAQEEFNRINKKLEALQFVEQFAITNELDKLIKGTREYNERIKQLKSELERLFGTEESIFALQPFRFGGLSGLQTVIKILENEKNELVEKERIANSKIISERQKFIDHLQKYNQIVVDSANISNRNVKILLDNYTRVFIESKDISKKNFDDIINEYKDFANNLLNYIEENKINVTELIESGDIQGLINILVAVTGNFELATQAVNQFSSSLKKNVQETQDNLLVLLDYEKAVEKINELHKEAERKITVLNRAIKDIEEGQALTAEAVAELTLLYPELSAHIKKVADGWTIELGAINKTREAIIQKQIDVLRSQAGITEGTFEEIRKRLKMYGIEIETIEELANAYEKFKGVVEEANKISGFMPHPAQGYMRSLSQQSEETKNLIENYLKIEELISRLEEIYRDKGFGISGSSKSGSKSGVSSKDPLAEAFREDLRQFEQLADLFEWSAYERLLALERIRQRHAKYLARSVEDERDLLLRIKDLREQNTREWLEKMEGVYQEFERQITQSQRFQLYMVEGTAEWTFEQEKQIKIMREWQKQLDEDIITIRRRIEADKTANQENKLTKQQLEDLKKQLEENINKWWELEEAILGATKQLTEFREENADEIIKNYKKMLEQMRDLELEAIRERMRLEDERHKQTIDHLNEELRQFQEIINARLQALERANEEEDYQRELQKLLDERAKIQEKYNTLLKDSSFEAKARRAELQQQLQELDERISNLQRERERELVRQALQDQLEERERYIEEQERLENQRYENSKRLLEREENDREIYWRSVLEDERRFYEMRQQLMSDDRNQVISIINQIRTEYDKFFDYLVTRQNQLGLLFTTIFNNFQQHLDVLNNFQRSGGTNIQIGGNTPTDYQTQILQRAWEEYLRNKQRAEELYDKIRSGRLTPEQEKAARDEIAKLRAINDGYRAKYGFPEGSYEQVKNLKPFSADTGGMTPAWGPEPKWLLAHEKELILNKHDTKNMLKIIDMTREIVNSMRNLDLSNLIKPVQVAVPSGAGTIIERMEINLPNVRNGQNFAEELIDSLSRKGIRVGRRFP